MKALGKGSIASLIRIGLQIAWVVLWIAAGFLLIGALGYGAAIWALAAGMVEPGALTGDEGAFVRIEDGRIAYANWPVVAPALLIGAVAVSGALIIVGRLRKLFDSFSSGEPFRRENADHLRVIWITMLAIELARYALQGLTGALIAGFGGPDIAPNYNVSIDLSAWGAILILIVLAEVFREGARMKEEQELTI